MEEMKPMQYVTDPEVLKYITDKLYNTNQRACIANFGIDSYLTLKQISQEIISGKINKPLYKNDYLNHKYMEFLTFGAASAIYNNDYLLCLLYSDEILQIATDAAIKTKINEKDYIEKLGLSPYLKGTVLTLAGASEQYHNNLPIRFVTKRSNVYDPVQKSTLSYIIDHSAIKGYVGSLKEVTNSPFEPKTERELIELNKKDAIMARASITNMGDYTAFKAAKFLPQGYLNKYAYVPRQ